MTREHEVCSLTGMVLGCGEMVWQMPKSRNPFYRSSNTHQGFTTLNQVNPVCAANVRCKHTAITATHNLFCGKARIESKQKSVSKIVDLTKKLIKNGASFAKIQAACATATQRAGRNLLGPVPSLNPAIDALAELVSSYVIRLQGPRTTKFTTALTAAIFCRLATGFSVGGTVIIPKVSYVEQNCPPELLHPKLLNVPCRAVSFANRHLATVTTTTAGYAIPEMVFPLSKLSTCTQTQARHSLQPS